jgi:4-amino-4-deoxy-L-arabinose transferase-like glycosyltransferase
VFSEVGPSGIGYAGFRPLGDVLADPFRFAAQAWSAYRPALIGYVTAPLLVAAAAGAVLLWRARPRAAVLLLVWIAVLFAVALTFSTLSFPRHVMYVLPPMIVLMAVALVRLGDVALAASSARAATVAFVSAAVVLLGPALVFDVRVLAHPDRAHYPGPDDLQYVRGSQAGAPWPTVVGAIHRRARGRHVVIVVYRSYEGVIRWLLRPEPRYEIVSTGNGAAPSAQFLIRDESNFFYPNDRGLKLIRRHFRLIGRFERPRGGAVMRLYENRHPAGAQTSS